MYILLNELKAPFRINKFIYAIDLIILAVFAMGGALLQQYVFQPIQWIFFIFNLFVGVFMTLPSFVNPQKRNFQTLFILLRASIAKGAYHSVAVEYSSKDTMKMRKSNNV